MSSGGLKNENRCLQIVSSSPSSLHSAIEYSLIINETFDLKAPLFLQTGSLVKSIASSTNNTRALSRNHSEDRKRVLKRKFPSKSTKIAQPTGEACS